MTTARAAGPEISAVCCIEYGRLEEQTVLMARSLRRFGGHLADMPLLAVVGRRGPPLRTRTLEELSRLGVSVVRARREDNPAPWLNYMNKIAAVKTADRIARTDQILWLDSDIFFIDEPTSLALQDDEDFRASCIALPPVVTETDQSHAPYLRRVCEVLGAEYDEIPWVDPVDGLGRRKANFSSGIFTWRKGGSFARHYHDAVRKLLASRIAQHTGIFFVADQAVLAPLLVRENMGWREYDLEDHSIVLGGLIAEGPQSAPHFGRARILHYSNSFSPPFRASMEARLRRENPELAGWLAEQERDLDLGRAGPVSRGWAATLKLHRGLRYGLYGKRVKKVGA